MSAPKSIDIQVSKEEILNDMYTWMEAMSEIRNKSINDRTSSQEDIQNYHNFTKLLSTQFVGMSDGPTRKKLEVLVGGMNRNPALVHFDTMQRRYWERSEPEFMNILDSLIIQLYGEQFDSLDKVHHIISALKYQCASVEEDPEEKEHIINSILPVNGRVRTNNPTVLLNDHLVNKDDNKNVYEFDLGDIVGVIKNNVLAARELGALSVTVKVDRPTYEKLLDEFETVNPEKTKGSGSNERITAKIQVNKAPNQYHTTDVVGNLRNFLENQELTKIMKYAPSELSNIYTSLDYDLFLEKMLTRFGKQFPQVDANKINKKQGIDEFIQTLKSIGKEIVSNPQIFGYNKGDYFEVNEKVIGPDNDETLWVGTTGTIIGIDKALTIEFDKPKIKGRKNKKGEVRIWDLEPEYLKKIADSPQVYPKWYKSKNIEIGDRVKNTEKCAEDYVIEEGDLNVGSCGQVVGFTYNVRLTKIVNANGAVTEIEQENNEILQVYLTRTNNPSEELSDKIKEMVDQSLSDMRDNEPSEEKKLDYLETKKTKWYINCQQVDHYDKVTLFIPGENMSYVMHYVVEHEVRAIEGEGTFSQLIEKLRKTSGKIDDQQIVDFIVDFKGTSESMFRKVAEVVQPIYISMSVHKEGKQLNYYEARR